MPIIGGPQPNFAALIHRTTSHVIVASYCRFVAHVHTTLLKQENARSSVARLASADRRAELTHSHRTIAVPGTLRTQKPVCFSQVKKPIHTTTSCRVLSVLVRNSARPFRAILWHVTFTGMTCIVVIDRGLAGYRRRIIDIKGVVRSPPGVRWSVKKRRNPMADFSWLASVLWVSLMFWHGWFKGWVTGRAYSPVKHAPIIPPHFSWEPDHSISGKEDRINRSCVFRIWKELLSNATVAIICEATFLVTVRTAH